MNFTDNKQTNKRNAFKKVLIQRPHEFKKMEDIDRNLLIHF